MSRGPPPTPTKLLKARGSWRAKKRRDEAVFAEGVPEFPAWMPVTGRDEWQRVVAEMRKTPGLLQQVDWAVLACYCETWADYVAMVKAEKCKPREYLISSGMAGQKRKLIADLSRLAQQFGFTPASRSRVQASKNENETEGKEARFFSPRIAKTS